jgi:hypothetical protein
MRTHFLQLACRLEHRYSSTGLPQGDSGSEAPNACAHNAHMDTLTHSALSLSALHCLSVKCRSHRCFVVFVLL